MKYVSALCTVALLTALTAGCDASLSSDAATTAGPATAAVQGARAVVGCNLDGTAQVLVPISDHDAYLVSAPILQSTCVSTPNGTAVERITVRVPNDIPRPARAIRVSGADNPFNLINVGGTFNIVCGYDGDVTYPTVDTFTSQYLPSGIATLDCRF